MVLAVPKESWPGERRVAATPETVTRLVGMGFDVRVEADAGLKAAFADEDYAKAGATLVGEPGALWSAADVLLKVQPPSPDEVDRLKPGAVLISLPLARQEQASWSSGWRRARPPRSPSTRCRASRARRRWTRCRRWRTSPATAR